MDDLLFEPLPLGSITVKNRFFMPAMHLNMCDNFQVTERLIDFYKERAKGGVGCITVGYATVDEFSGAPGNIGSHDDSFLPGLQKLAAAIKEGGALAAVQLNHAGRYNSSFFLGGKQPVAPSAVPSRMTRETPRELSVVEIKEIISRFGDAALRVKEAGFDLVELLAGTGYLISSFLSPFTNKRDDHYGGSLENRMRLGIEVVRHIKERLGQNYPLMVRLNGNDFMEGGITQKELLTFAKSLETEGVDGFNINVGWHEAQMVQLVTKVPRGVFAYLARNIRQAVGVPVIGSHRINDPTAARRLVVEKFCDGVAVGRALIADPQFVEKAAKKQDHNIIHCVACGQGCFDNLFKMKAVECLCNPRAGHESKRQVVKTERPKYVMVVGAGVAGMAAALAASENGHRVHLYEQSTRLGGQLRLAGAPPGREEFRLLANDLAIRISQSKVKLFLDATVDKDFLLNQKPDELVLATGGRPITPPIPGVELDHVVQGWEVLQGTRQVGERVVVVGGGAVGVETALKLAEEGTLSGEELKFLLVHKAVEPEELYTLATQGHREIVLVEMSDRLGANFGRSTRWGMLQDLERYKIQPLLGTKVLEITPDGVVVEQQDGTRQIKADSVVLGVGTEPVNYLGSVASDLGIHYKVVGDAFAPATLFEANHMGFEAGWSIT